MWLVASGLALSLAIILISCELFTNGVEWLGKKLKLGDGVVGSILSAVGTCLPETMIPLIAILFSDKSKHSIDIGIGAIAGAPFMLGTLAFFITGLSVLIFWKRRKTGMTMRVNSRILRRDMGFFILVYIVGIGASFFEARAAKYFFSGFLAVCYIYYILLTVSQDKQSHNQVEPLYLTQYLNLKPRMGAVLIQITLALGGIIFGAEIFVKNIENSSHTLGIPALILSLIVAPIATELPEKFNSIIWISKRKDTLALGNITGAMVFQSCIPVSIGILATPWKLEANVIFSAAMAILSTAVCYLWISLKGKLSPVPLMLGGIFYVAYIAYIAAITLD